MNLNRLWNLADRARQRRRFTAEEVVIIRDELPLEFRGFPDLELPERVRYPAGFSISGAAIGTFLRSALLLSGQTGLGRRFDGLEFYELVEKDLAFRIMRSHFHHGYPKGSHCCARCTLAVYPVLEAGAIRYFDCGSLSKSVRALIEEGNGDLAPRRTQRWSTGHWADKRSLPGTSAGEFT